MRRIKSHFLHAVEGKSNGKKRQKPHPCKLRKSAAPGKDGAVAGEL
jgi:hypothetical protein